LRVCSLATEHFHLFAFRIIHLQEEVWNVLLCMKEFSASATGIGSVYGYNLTSPNTRVVTSGWGGGPLFRNL
jgi:hypothetical protein